MSLWVINASPLILLGRIGLLDLAVDLCDELIVTEAVANEIAAGPADDAARLWLVAHGARITRVDPRPEPDVLAWDLGAGETGVLSWALANPGAVCVLDDRAARTCARAFSLPLTGTLGVLLAAKKAGRLATVAPLLDALIREGSLLSPALRMECLRLAGE